MDEYRTINLGTEIDLRLAARYFEETNILCVKDNGTLWGIPLYGPLIFVDYESHAAVANQPDTEKYLSRFGNVYTGSIPEGILIANTSMEWAGVRWTMILWQSLSENPLLRQQLILHESFHRIQGDLGLPIRSPACTHLESVQGRVWLRLEWLALEKALGSDADVCQQVLTDALTFRHYRHSLFTGTRDNERRQELHEGLAAYTGVKLSQTPVESFREKILQATARYPSFSRSFSFYSGPAYGLLLDRYDRNWRALLSHSSDLGQMLGSAADLHLPENLKKAAERSAEDYGIDAILAYETGREQDFEEKASTFKNLFLKGPTLHLPISSDVQYAFNPANSLPLDDEGTVMPEIHVRDEWGLLDVSSNGLLMDSQWKWARIPAPTDPDDRPLKGNVWQLELAYGWTISPGGRPGDFVLVKTGS